jgi:hypothetical protein
MSLGIRARDIQHTDPAQTNNRGYTIPVMTATKETNNMVVAANRTATTASNQAPDLEFESSAVSGAPTSAVGDLVDIVALPQGNRHTPRAKNLLTRIAD